MPLLEEKVVRTIARCAQGLNAVSVELVVQELLKTVFDGITTAEIEKAAILAAAAFIERDPQYDTLAARLLLQSLQKQVFSAISREKWDPVSFEQSYRQSFIDAIQQGVAAGHLDARLGEFDLMYLAQELVLERDALLEYMGLHILYERYFLKLQGRRVELPQAFWMRIAMGLALQENNKEERAISFYKVMSTLRYIPSTPTLFHAGYPIAQLSSCYLNTVSDDLKHIFKCIGDNAQLAKWAGGIGTDWTNIRATGALIKSIKATSQGVIPFLKIANDLVVAITKSGIRRGGTCVYLEAWHLDVEEFIDLRRNTGDDRRRTHDMSTALWVPDLFMKRVLQDGQWTLFSPDEVPELHHIYGSAFEKRYIEYEQLAAEGKISLYKIISAKQLWRKVLSRLFETGHPWINFKDPSNIRSPQDHVGVIHSSNLCTEITLNTSEEETAVCNLGSVNIARHIINGMVDDQLLKETVELAVRMLDNVIDLNFYPTPEAKVSNMRHRPIGLGIMGFQDALFKLDIPFESYEALAFADTLQEKIAYYAIGASCSLAQERGAYSSFVGSKWDRQIFPVDTLSLLEKERGMPIEVSRTSTLDWAALKNKVKQYGMRNSNVMSIAPTATIANIAGCYPSIEPIYKNIYVKSNVAGEFTVVNKYLVEDLKKLGLWNQTMLDQLKYYDGDLTLIKAIPVELKEKYKTAFEIDPEWLIKITAARGKWIDQSQSHNIFFKGTSGKKMHDVYIAAWRSGLKTTYYFRTLAATQIEKSTLDAATYGFTQKREYGVEVDNFTPATSCRIENESCESCQ